MAKTDKELTVEIVCSHINAWGTQENCSPITNEDLPEIIKSVYNVIHSLGDESERK